MNITLQPWLPQPMTFKPNLIPEFMLAPPAPRHLLLLRQLEEGS